jgi:2-succinyl-6-hydroxy-2,4-cyclohexadiene-1-carboxylate synthase
MDGFPTPPPAHLHLDCKPALVTVFSPTNDPSIAFYLFSLYSYQGIYRFGRYQEARMHDMRVNVGQIELQVRDYEHSADAIIFLHFSGANLMMWYKAVPYFRDRFHLLLVDLRGHGKSDTPINGYYMDEMARDVIGLMDQLSLERAYIIGSSLGAEVGLSLAANYPQRVISLVCDGALSSEFGPYGTWEDSESKFEAYIAQQLERMHNAVETTYPSVDALVEKSRHSLEEIGWWNADVEAMERYGAIKLDEGKYTKAFRKFAREDYMQHYFHYHLENYYPRVRCPLLMLPGVDVFENVREKAAMEGLKQLAPFARIAVVAGWQHPYGWMLDPARTCRAILEFLEDSL